MNTVLPSPTAPQAGFRPVGELTAALAHPLARAAERLDSLARDEAHDALDAEAFGNPTGSPGQRLRAAALCLAAEELRDALRYECPPSGEGFTQAIALLNELAASAEAQADDEVRPRKPNVPPDALAEFRPIMEAAPLIAAGYRADAASLRYAAHTLEGQTAL